MPCRKTSTSPACSSNFLPPHFRDSSIRPNRLRPWTDCWKCRSSWPSPCPWTQTNPIDHSSAPFRRSAVLLLWFLGRAVQRVFEAGRCVRTETHLFQDTDARALAVAGPNHLLDMDILRCQMIELARIE